MDICESPRRAVCQTVTFMAGTHYPCSRAVHGREHGPWTRASFFGHLRYTGDQHGLRTWVSFFDTSVSGPCSRAVNSSSLLIFSFMFCYFIFIVA